MWSVPSNASAGEERGGAVWTKEVWRCGGGVAAGCQRQKAGQQDRAMQPVAREDVEAPALTCSRVHQVVSIEEGVQGAALGCCPHPALSRLCLPVVFRNASKLLE